MHIPLLYQMMEVFEDFDIMYAGMNILIYTSLYTQLFYLE